MPASQSGTQKLPQNHFQRSLTTELIDFQILYL